MFVYIWTLFKTQSVPQCLFIGQQVLERNGFRIIDPANDRDVHVLGYRASPEARATVVCTRAQRGPTSIVIHVWSNDESVARTTSAALREGISQSVRFDDGTVLRPADD